MIKTLRISLTTLFVLTLQAYTVFAQVPVKEEPRHRNVFENEYFRLLDVRIAPGDTSLFHIHSTPSIFLVLETTPNVGVQVWNSDWTKGSNIAGQTWFESFRDATLTHRVTNSDSVAFHVTDLELLSEYGSGEFETLLPFEPIFENEQIIVFSIDNTVFDQRITKSHGPMMMQMVSGNQVSLIMSNPRKRVELKKGDHYYIRPGQRFYLKSKEENNVQLILVGIK